jgi:hypothetical protein
MLENGHAMEVTAWNNGQHHESGAGYAIRISINDRDNFFQEDWQDVTIEFPDGTSIEANLTDTFWETCPEIRSQAIGRWIRTRGEAPWPARQPPHYRLILVRDQRFRLEPL